MSGAGVARHVAGLPRGFCSGLLAWSANHASLTVWSATESVTAVRTTSQRRRLDHRDHAQRIVESAVNQREAGVASWDFVAVSLDQDTRPTPPPRSASFWSRAVLHSGVNWASLKQGKVMHTSESSGVDPDGLHEYSVVFTDRALNHMSQRFQQVMRDLSKNLKAVYRAHAVALVPGGGSTGMESVARQFAHDKNVLVIRNGWFSYRWSQVFETAKIPARTTVLKARPIDTAHQAPFAPPPIDEVIATIAELKPDLVFAAHVETSSGILLPDEYLQRVATAVHEHGGLFVLDCIASGALWVDMARTGVDVLLSAPQKTWSSTPSAALIMLSAQADARLKTTQSTSFTLDLAKWRAIMAAYEKGGHGYHSTMPTDALGQLRDAMLETMDMGLEIARNAQCELGQKVRATLARRGLLSVAAEGFQAPGVVVSYTDIDAIHNGSAFAERGLQIAAGTPLACDEPDNFKTFRLGLFGIDKLKDVDGTVQRLDDTLAQILG
jgi:aspartate aminotransferase-like enzyme